MDYLKDIGESAKKAARALSTSSAQLRHQALTNISKHLLDSQSQILEKNILDIETLKTQDNQKLLLIDYY